MGNSVVDAVMEAMLKNSSAKLISGDYSQAIDESAKYLSSVEGLKPESKKIYTPVIIKLYGIRAQSHYMLWLQTKDEHLLQEAKLDLEKAIQSAEILCQSISNENLIALKVNILNLINEDANLRKASLRALTEIKIEADAENHVTSYKALNKFWSYVVFFFTGATAWGIFPLIFFITGESNSTTFVVIVGVLFFLLFMLTLKGWNWYSQYKFGSYGSLIKFMSTLFIGLTVIGLIPICYWTGKGIFRWIDEIRGKVVFPKNIFS